MTETPKRLSLRQKRPKVVEDWGEQHPKKVSHHLSCLDAERIDWRIDLQFDLPSEIVAMQ